jgi:hypothetical protein
VFNASLAMPDLIFPHGFKNDARGSVAFRDF